MDMRFFFEGKLSREESASAFLATLLAGDPDFRQATLRRVLGDDAYEDRESWSVSVETNNVDIVMTSPSLDVLVENKISAGAVAHGQLRDYYLAAVATVPPGRRIAAVYVAPGQLGQREVAAVRAVKREGDAVEHLSWQSDVAGMVRAQRAGEQAWFAATGLESVLAAIENNKKVKYPLVGERIVVDEIANWALAKMTAAFPDIQLGRWRGADSEEIYTVRVPVTLQVAEVFPYGAEPYFEPLTLRKDGQRSVSVRSKFKLAGSAKKHSALAHHWLELRNAGSFTVEGVGPHTLGPDGWFDHVEVGIVGTTEGIAERMAAIGIGVLGALRPLHALEPGEVSS